MENQYKKVKETRMELANRLFFKLYQCANMLHKTGSRAVESEGLTTQQWAVLGALSTTDEGMSIGALARYLMVSRQNLAGLIGRMERQGHVCSAPDGRDRRSRLVAMTPAGRLTWGLIAAGGLVYYTGALAALGAMAAGCRLARLGHASEPVRQRRGQDHDRRSGHRRRSRAPRNPAAAGRRLERAVRAGADRPPGRA